MKRLILTSLVLSLSCYSYSQQSVGVSTPDVGKIEWLTGTWERTGTKPGRTGHERWEKISDTELQGFGVTLQGQDTVFLEKLRIVVKDRTLYYVAEVPHNKQPVFFKFTELSDNGFVCENPEHDFPKKITYQLSGTSINATISGDGKSFDYSFERKK